MGFVAILDYPSVRNKLYNWAIGTMVSYRRYNFYEDPNACILTEAVDQTGICRVLALALLCA